MARSRRDRQIHDHMTRRQRSIELAVAEEIMRAAAKSERYFRSGGRPRGEVPYFCYCTQAVDLDLPGDGGRVWVSWVTDFSAGHTTGDAVIPQSIELHKQRKAAKSRAWNLYQGWRYARGLNARWGTFA